MANQSKFEAMLEKLIAEDKAGAEELFHEIVVEKSRSIYEGLIEDDVKDVEVDEASKSEDLLNSINIDIKEIKGKTLFDVLPILENLGFTVESVGEGMNIKDYRLENIVENKKIIIELSWIYWEIFYTVLI